MVSTNLWRGEPVLSNLDARKNFVIFLLIFGGLFLIGITQRFGIGLQTSILGLFSFQQLLGALMIWGAIMLWMRWA